MGLLSAIKSAASKVASAASKAVKAATNVVKAAVSTVSSAVKSASSTVSKAVSAVSKAVSSVTSPAVKSASSTVKSAVASAANVVVNAASAVSAGIENVKAAVSAVVDSARGKAANIIERVKNVIKQNEAIAVITEAVTPVILLKKPVAPAEPVKSEFQKAWEAMIENVKAGKWLDAAINLISLPFASVLPTDETVYAGTIPLAPAVSGISPEILAKLGPKITIWGRIVQIIKNLGASIAKNPLIAIFAATEIPQLITMMTFASKWKAEQLGESQTGISIQLNNMLKSFESLGYTYRENIKGNNFEQAEETLGSMRNLYEEFDALIESKKDILTNAGEYDAFKAISDFMKSSIDSMKLGTLKVTANVSGPDVYIDGIKKGIAPLTIALAPEYHHVLVSKFQHTNYEEDVLVKKGEVVEIAAVINPIAQPGAGKGTLKLVVEPTDAVIFVPQHDEITKMGNYELDSGSYSVRASKEGYYDKTATAIITGGEVSNVSIILTQIPVEPAPVKGIIHVIVIPADSLIEVGGLSSNASPADFQLDAGTYVVKASREGYYDKFATVYLKEGETYPVNLQLAEVPSTSTPSVPGEVPTEEVIVPLDPYVKTYNAWKYTINAVASDTGEILHAAIFIDGAALGKYTPWSIYLYPESRYILRLEKWGYQTAEVEINTPPIPE